jgi:hypothetical protein
LLGLLLSRLSNMFFCESFVSFKVLITASV